MDGPRPSLSLVVNADEFGLSPEVSRGVLQAHRTGIVTSTSVLGNCPNLEEVKALLGTAPGLGVGVQLTLLRGLPISDPGSVPTLIAPHGGFASQARDVYLSWMTRDLNAPEIEHEFDAQVKRMVEAGLRPDHLNTHHHIGCIPPVGLAVEAVAKRHGIPGVRSALEEPTLTWVTDLPRGAVAAALSGLTWFTRRRMGTLRHGPRSWGYVESGQLDEVRILEILGRMGPGSHELLCHPGEYDDPTPGLGLFPHTRFRRARELAALTSPIVKQALQRRDVKLCRWGDLF